MSYLASQPFSHPVGNGTREAGMGDTRRSRVSPFPLPECHSLGMTQVVLVKPVLKTSKEEKKFIISVLGPIPALANARNTVLEGNLYHVFPPPY